MSTDVTPDDLSAAVCGISNYAIDLFISNVMVYSSKISRVIKGIRPISVCYLGGNYVFESRQNVIHITAHKCL